MINPRTCGDTKRATASAAMQGGHPGAESAVLMLGGKGTFSLARADAETGRVFSRALQAGVDQLDSGHDELPGRVRFPTTGG